LRPLAQYPLPRSYLPGSAVGEALPIIHAVINERARKRADTFAPLRWTAVMHEQVRLCAREGSEHGALVRTLSPFRKACRQPHTSQATRQRRPVMHLRP